MPDSRAVEYRCEETLSVDEFVDLLHRSSLAERRPCHDRDRLNQMLQNASFIVTARVDSVLVGIARSISDLGFCTYLSDLAVDREFQGQGIGRRLIDETRQAAPESTLILLAAPQVTTYYPHIGMEEHNSCWILRPDSQ